MRAIVPALATRYPDSAGSGGHRRRLAADADRPRHRVRRRVDPGDRPVVAVDDPDRAFARRDGARTVADGDRPHHGARTRLDPGDGARLLARDPERTRAGRHRGRVRAESDRPPSRYTAELDAIEGAVDPRCHPQRAARERHGGRRVAHVDLVLDLVGPRVDLHDPARVAVCDPQGVIAKRQAVRTSSHRDGHDPVVLAVDACDRPVQGVRHPRGPASDDHCARPPADGVLLRDPAAVGIDHADGVLVDAGKPVGLQHATDSEGRGAGEEQDRRGCDQHSGAPVRWRPRRRWPGLSGRRRRGAVQRRVLGEDRVVQAPQFGAWLDADLLNEHHAPRGRHRAPPPGGRSDTARPCAGRGASHAAGAGRSAHRARR
jgi:hypothetical protein